MANGNGDGTGTDLVIVQNLKTAGAFLEKAKGRLAQVIAKNIDPERLIRVAQLAMSQNPRLLECTAESLLVSLMECGQLGLEPNGVLGDAYLIPYKNGRLSREMGRPVYEAQFQIGYRGLVKLVRRSGEIGVVEAVEVYEGDAFEFERGLRPILRHRPAPASERGELTHAYAIARYRDGSGEQFEVMDRDQIEMIRRRSKSAEDGPWITDYPMMARKTVVKRLTKMLPMEAAAAAAIERDNLADIGRFVPLSHVHPSFRDVGALPSGDEEEPRPTRTDSVREKLQRRAARDPETETEAIPDAEYAAANLRLPDDDELLPFEADDRAGDLTALAAATERPARAPSAQSEGR